ncbi:organic cation transporter protein-like [Plodia interpunctella]|uniref:organic cation transporter protein-like n=1 Tax=Plodia interpunctella TaxID=58824 RepID=UPI002367929E|nr:organic cation transporter protein-like isoform X1 [Plodia interpunctella]
MTVVNVGPKSTNNKNFEDVLKFGRYQILQYFLMCVPVALVSMAHVNYVFVAEEVDHRCLVPECDSANPEAATPSWWPPGLDKKCYKPVVDQAVYDSNNQTCSKITFEKTENCKKWVYESDNSIFSSLDLGCQSWKAAMVGFVHNAGMITSMLTVGWLSDKFGRRPLAILCSIGGCIGLLKIFMTNYYAYVVIEFLESVLESGLYTVGVVLMLEVGGETKRILTTVIFSYAVYIGEILFAVEAMFLKHWKSLTLVVYTPMIVFILYFPILRESMRWQLLRGKTSEVKETFKKIVNINKINVTPAEIDALSDEEIRLKFNVTLQTEKEKFKEIIASKEIMKRVGVASACFFTSSFLYYGLMVNSVLLPGNKYINFMLSSLIAFPGDLMALFVLGRFGRRMSLQGAYIFTAVFLIAQTYTPLYLSWLKVCLFLMGKACVVICFTSIYTYALELFPTSVRGSLFGFGSTIARVGGMLAPLTPLLATKLSEMPSILFAATAIISASLLIITPETKNLPMFDTIVQVEAHKHKTITHL